MSDYETALRQLQFLLDCANDREPLTYVTANRRCRVILTRLFRSEPYKCEDGQYEPVIRLVLVEAWSGFQVQSVERAKVQAATAFSLPDYEPAYWDGQDAWGWATWG
jgi:hypothetical protein